MDSLIALLVIVFIFNALTGASRKKKREERQRAQAQRAQTAQPGQPGGSAASEGQARIPYTREEWERYARDLNGGKAAQPGNSARDSARAFVEAERQPAEPKVSVPEGRTAETAAPSVRAAAPKVTANARESFGEGSVSTQGESEAEHAEHVRRAAAEEASRQATREALRDLHDLRRERLRTAVVMSEVLGKPVALRARTGLHR